MKKHHPAAVGEEAECSVPVESKSGEVGGRSGQHSAHGRWKMLFKLNQFQGIAGTARYAIQKIGVWKFLVVAVLGISGRLSLLACFLLSIKIIVGVINGNLQQLGARYGLSEEMVRWSVALLVPFAFWFSALVRSYSEKLRFAESVKLEEYVRRDGYARVLNGGTAVDLEQWILKGDTDLRGSGEPLFGAVFELVEITFLLALLMIALIFLDPVVAAILGGLLLACFAYGLRHANAAMARQTAIITERIVDYHTRKKNAITMLQSERPERKKVVRMVLDVGYRPEQLQQRFREKMGTKVLLAPIYGVLGILFSILMVQFQSKDDLIEKMPTLIMILFVLRFSTGLIQGLFGCSQRFLRHRKMAVMVGEFCK